MRMRSIVGIMFILICIGIVLFLLGTTIAIVPAGNVGVYDMFGQVETSERNPGIQFKNPFANIHMMSIQTQEVKEQSSVPSKEGLIVTLDVSILFHIDGNQASDIYKNIGLNYADVVVIPQFRSFIREISAKYEAKALYTIGRENITIEIYEVLAPVLLQRGIILEKVLLRDLTLPSTVTTAIEMKLKSEQEAQQMEFVLQKERLEADRKVVEAHGIADAQDIIHKSLTPEYLKWYWLTHIKDAQSVIYVPISGDGYPIMNIPVNP